MPRRYSMSCRSSRIRAGEHACTVHLVEAEGHAVLARCADKRWAFLMKSRDRRAGQGEARWLLQLCRLKLCQLAIASARAQTSATTDSCRQPTASRPSRGRGARSRVVGDGVGSISSRARRRHQSKNCFTARALAVRVLRLRVPSSPRLPKFRLAAIRLLYHSINVSLRRSFRVTGEKRRADLLEAKLTMVFTQQS